MVIVGAILLAFGTPVSGQDAPQPDRIELALSDPAFDWHELETENFRVYYLIQALTPADAEYAGRDLENSLEHNLGLLQEQHDPDPIRALIVGSRDEMAQVIGRPYGGVALPDERAVVFTTVRALWSNGWIGGAESLGMTAEALEQAWRVSISEVAPAPSSAWDRIRSVGCEGP